MTRRRRTLLVPVAGLLAAGLIVGASHSGCSRSPQPEVAPTGKAPTPEGPPRKPMSEKERLLVGKWKLVKETPPINPAYEARYEYRPDGTFTYWNHSPLAAPWAASGTYRVHGNLLLRTWSNGRPLPNVLIESITGDRLVYSRAVEDEEQHVAEYARVRGK